jgi:cobalt-zinc-cadmium efflux system outer membrane protein
MNIRLPLFLALIFLIGSPAWAGYRDLLHQWESYKPSEFYESNVHLVPAGAISATLPSIDFEAQVARLKEVEKQWQAALRAIEEEKEALFFKPDPSSLLALRPAEQDAEFAEHVLAKSFSLEGLEILALLRNPAVKAAQDGMRASINGYSQVWNLDEILRQYSAFTEALMTGVGPMRGREPVELRFPFPGVMALKGEIVTQEVNVAIETLAISRRSAISMARRLYWELLFVRRAQKITEEMLRLLQHLEDVATTRYEAGKTSFQDVIKIRIQRETLGEDLKTLGESQRNVEVKMVELLNLSPMPSLGAPIAQTPSRSLPNLDALYALSLESRQEIRLLKAKIGKMERAIELAETAIYPSYALNLSLFEDQAIRQVGTQRTEEPFAVSTTPSTGAGLPRSPWYGANDAYLRETRQKLAALRQELKNTEDQTRVAVREGWFRLDLARREADLYEKSVVGLSKSALDVSTSGYETGGVSFADVIASYTTWLKASLTLDRQRSDLGVARSDLEETVGAQWE